MPWWVTSVLWSHFGSDMRMRRDLKRRSVAPTPPAPSRASAIGKSARNSSQTAEISNRFSRARFRRGARDTVHASQLSVDHESGIRLAGKLWKEKYENGSIDLSDDRTFRDLFSRRTIAILILGQRLFEPICRKDCSRSVASYHYSD